MHKPLLFFARSREEIASRLGSRPIPGWLDNHLTHFGNGYFTSFATVPLQYHRETIALFTDSLVDVGDVFWKTGALYLAACLEGALPSRVTLVGHLCYLDRNGVLCEGRVNTPPTGKLRRVHLQQWFNQLKGLNDKWPSYTL